MITMNKHKFNQANTKGDVNWFTPPQIVKALGSFDLDPCTHVDRPWDTAVAHLTIEDNGLLLPWAGRVWMNPPYTRDQIGLWFSKLAEHGNGCALVFNRSDTEWYQDYVFPHATSILYKRGRIHFHYLDGTRAKSNSGAPSVIIAYGENNADAIEDSGIKGHHQYLGSNLLVIGLAREYGKTWKVVVGEAIRDLGDQAKVQDIYEAVLELAPKKVRENKNHKAKIRQTLQRYFTRIGKGEYVN